MAALRLQKFLSSAGVASRRKAEELIKTGRVKVNGVTVTKLGTKIDAGKDRVTIGQREITPPNQHNYVIINKPKGYITTVTDPKGRNTVLDLVSNLDTRLYPVGRLDQNTTGLLLLTDDGELAYRLSHPKFGVEKVYEVKIKGYLAPADKLKLEKGIEIEGKITSPAEAKIVSSDTKSSTVNIKIHEGRKRQVRLMFTALNHPVLNLKRVEYAGLKLNNLNEGQFRHLNSQEINLLKKKVGLSDAGQVKNN